jgi:hypothetical protein
MAFLAVFIKAAICFHAQDIQVAGDFTQRLARRAGTE